MIWATRTAALSSLNEFSPEIRIMHRIVRFYSTRQHRYLYTRIFVGRRGKL